MVSKGRTKASGEEEKSQLSYVFAKDGIRGGTLTGMGIVQRKNL